MTDIVEVANKLYNRNYVSFSRGMCPFGEVLTFKGTAGELTILESEMQFHIHRQNDYKRKLNQLIIRENPADFEPLKSFTHASNQV